MAVPNRGVNRKRDYKGYSQKQPNVSEQPSRAREDVRDVPRNNVRC